MIGVWKLGNSFASGVWHRAVRCLLVIALIAYLVDPALAALPSPSGEANGPETVTMLSGIFAAPSMDELSSHNFAGYVRCSLHCFCHAIVLPDSPDVAILRIAELSKFSVGSADLSWIILVPPSKPPRY